MGYNARNDEIRDNVTRMRDEVSFIKASTIRAARLDAENVFLRRH